MPLVEVAEMNLRSYDFDTPGSPISNKFMFSRIDISYVYFMGTPPTSEHRHASFGISFPYIDGANDRMSMLSSCSGLFCTLVSWAFATRSTAYMLFSSFPISSKPYILNT